MKRQKFTLVILGLFAALFSHVSAQTVIYTQNFDASSQLPAGWYASPNSWTIDTTGNASTGYTGATGAHNVVIKDTTARIGNDTLITAAISTVGYNSITIEWAARFSKHFADSGSVVSLYWSVNGTSWTPVTYTENSNNSTWALENGATPIALPAAAAGQASLQLMWVADIHFTPSGTYRIDDLAVSGTPASGIMNVDEVKGFAKVFVSAADQLTIALNEPLSEPATAEIYDLSGRLISVNNIYKQNVLINTDGIAMGTYLVRVYNSTETVVTKVVF